MSQTKSSARERLNAITSAATKDSVSSIAMGIIFLGVAYGDVMFLQLMWDFLPGGILRVLAAGGAVVTALSIMTLTLGKQHWFHPGKQMNAAKRFTWIEIGVMALNVLVSVMVARRQDLGLLQSWLDYGTPITPFMAVVGWIIVAWNDPSREMRHLKQAAEDEQELATLDRELEIKDLEAEYQQELSKASIHARRQQLETVVTALSQAGSDPRILDALRLGGMQQAAQIAAKVSGVPVVMPFQLQAPTTVTGSLSAAPTQNPPPRPAAASSQPTSVPPASGQQATPVPGSVAAARRAQRQARLRAAQARTQAQASPQPTGVSPDTQPLEVLPPFAAAPSRSSKKNGAKQHP
ncbi:MAG: hypothetical protein H0W02_18780 [Ktedonobacteraceae bacterium]|nr:hypothetical protein [Ktedonobacteraceae bacterium]